MIVGCVTIAMTTHMLVCLSCLGKRNEPNLMHRPSGIPIGLGRGRGGRKK